MGNTNDLHIWQTNILQKIFISFKELGLPLSFYTQVFEVEPSANLFPKK